MSTLDKVKKVMERLEEVCSRYDEIHLSSVSVDHRGFIDLCLIVPQKDETRDIFIKTRLHSDEMVYSNWDGFTYGDHGQEYMLKLTNVVL